MVKGDYKKVLWRIFDVLGLTEDEKNYAVEKFKKKFATELLKPLQERLDQGQRDWISQNMDNRFIDESKAMEIRAAIRSAFTESEIDRLSHQTFKAILVRYSGFLEKKLADEDISSKIRSIVEDF